MHIVNHKRFLGYTKDKKGGNLVIVPKEAEAIRLVFKMYIEGKGARQIARAMEELGYKTGAGKANWRESTVLTIIKNEKYCGDLLQQKTLTVDYLTHKQVLNNNIAPKFLIEDNHESIVDKETFELAQKIRKDRSSAYVGDNKNLSKYNNKYPFSSLLVCNKCGRTLKRRYWNINSPAQRVMQQCGSYIKGKDKCDAKAVYNDVLEGATLQMINNVFINKSNIISKVINVIKQNIKISETEEKINKLKETLIEKQLLINNLIDMKLKTPSFNDAIFTNKYNEIKTEIDETQIELEKLESKYLSEYETDYRIKKIADFIKSQENEITEITAEIVKSFIYRVLVLERDEIVYCIAGSTKYTDKEFIEKRNEFLNNQPIYTGFYTNEILKKSMKYTLIII